MQGANLAGHMRIGCPQDFASILPPVLPHFASLYLRKQIELFNEGDAALADAIDKVTNRYCRCHRPRRPCQCAKGGAVGSRIDRVICLNTAAEIAAAARRAWPAGALSVDALYTIWRRQIFPTAWPLQVPSLDELWTALLGGLGVTARTALNLAGGSVCAESIYGLIDEFRTAESY